MKTAAQLALLPLDIAPLPAAPTRGGSGRYTVLASDKLRGGYYTSSGIAKWLCRWAIRTAREKVLEPSCGDGAFLEVAAQRLHELGAAPSVIRRQLLGVEILDTEASKARSRLEHVIGEPLSSSVVTDDFFGWWQQKRPVVDVVIGNPPFIRYQSFPEESRARAMSIMGEQGLTPNRLTNIWVPFVVAAAASLRPGGRMALVLPAELMQVTYASQLRSFLADRFDRLDIVACNDLLFDNAEQEVVLLLADGLIAEPSAEHACRVTLSEVADARELLNEDAESLAAKAEPKIVRHDSEKWLKYFLTGHEIGLMRRLREAPETGLLSLHASVDVGVVTGKNEFFVLTEEQVRAHGLGDFVVPLVARSAHLEGAQLSKAEWRKLASNGERVYLFHTNGHEPNNLPAALKLYIRGGEVRDVHRGFKCSIRKPWHSVPAVWSPDCFFFRQIYDFPRVVLNKAGATATDTIHRMRCKDRPDVVAANLYSHLTAASAEIEGRSYGGGVLELEPNEAERLLVPAHLAKALPLTECDRLVRAGRLADLLEENDRLILRDAVGLSRGDCLALQGIWTRMRDRRMNRRRRPKRSRSAAD